MRRDLGIRKRIITAIASTALIGFALIALFNWNVNSKLLKEEAYDKLKYLCTNYSNYFDGYFEDAKKVVDIMEYQVVKKFDKTKLHDKTYLTKFTKDIDFLVKNIAENSQTGKTAYVYFNPKLTNAAFDVYYADEIGKGSVTRQKMLSIDYYKSYNNDKTKDWWFKPVLSKKDNWTEPYDWVLDNTKVVSFISYTRPIYINNTLLCVIGTDLRYTNMKEILENIKIYDTGNFFLLNEKLSYLIDNKNKVGDNLKDIDIKQYNYIKANLKLMNNTVLVDTKSSKNIVQAYSKLNNGWIIGLKVNSKEILTRLYEYQVITYIFIGIMLIVFLLISLKLGRLISKPIVELTNAIDKINEDELKIDIPENCFSRKDEIGILANVLSNMNTKIYEYFNKINLQNNELLIEIEYRKKLQAELEVMLKVIANTTEAIFVLDNNFHRIYSNNSFQKATGFLAKELSNKNILEEVLCLEKDIVGKIKANGFTGDIQLKEKTGREYPALILINRTVYNDTYYYVGILRDLTEEKSKEKAIDYFKNYDILTNLPNRYSFESYIKDYISNFKNESVSALILFNINNFRVINEARGFDFGNTILLHTSVKLKEYIGEGDMLTRLEGDEFAIFKTSFLSIKDIYDFIMKVNCDFKNPFKINDEDIFITISMGISIYPTDGLSYEDLIKTSTSALNYVKANRNSIYQFYNESINKLSIEKYEILNNLRTALEKEEFVIYYQPQIDIKANKVVGVEALLRWNSTKGFVPPALFIPIAEEARLIIPIGEYVLRNACKAGIRLKEMGHDIVMAVNISGVQFKSNYLVVMVSSIIKETQINPESLELEITEGILMDNAQDCEILIRELKNLGIKVSIDDFGTGYSSLAYLKRFVVDKIKIDRSFIKDIPKKDNGMIANTIIQLSKNLGLKVIAEGVETQDHVKFLEDNQCSEAQGFYYSKPLPENELIEFLKKFNGEN